MAKLTAPVAVTSAEWVELIDATEDGIVSTNANVYIAVAGAVADLNDSTDFGHVLSPIAGLLKCEGFGGKICARAVDAAASMMVTAWTRPV